MKSFFLLSCFIASSLMAQQPDTGSALFSMREAEWNFARESVMYGRNAAFVNNFADQSVIFTDKWITDAKQFWKDRKAAPSVLKWEPEFMDIAASGDFGISTGPWEAQEFRPNTKPVSTGYFLTVWKKQPNGDWKVILDAGTGTPPIKGVAHNFEFPPGADKKVTNAAVVPEDQSCRELIDREKQFSAEWDKNHLPATFNSFLAEGARVQFNGHLPTTSRDTINLWITQMDKKLLWNSTGAGAAISGDIGYTYGLVEIPGNPAVTKGHYVKIWKKAQGSGWRIILQMVSLD
jgi:ketosteroid isomerase-like protein